MLAPWLGLHALVAALATWAALAYARRRQLFDQPGERRSHSVPTPRGGGIGITCALLAGCVLLATTGKPLAPLAGYAVGLVLVAGIGWVDDHRPLSPWLRLVVQCLAGLTLGWGMLAGGTHWGWALLGAALVPVLVNVWNFMDGIDGLAASQAMLAAAAFAWLAPGTSAAGLALAVATAAFLPFNFPRARIFLGDVGSGTLGYALAALAAAAGPQLGGEGALLLLLPLSAFLVDASMTLASRALRGERWWEPHVTHLYQRWVQSGRSHMFVTMLYASFSIVAIILAAFLDNAASSLRGEGVALWVAVAAVGWAVLRRSLAPGNPSREDA
ncbi:MraY family glycosyltransferase [Pseudoxanthomonas suwonensis]|uniref:MraY family glycosyltransferase n=1 Tax=Pseudoxanthomonas suwonensis TaxID=314722 RepID=UPI0004AE70F6|nr:glycosyltransferase family 4 protein [Pseudoxanthomonas suwonensis]